MCFIEVMKFTAMASDDSERQKNAMFSVLNLDSSLKFCAMSGASCFQRLPLGAHDRGEDSLPGTTMNHVTGSRQVRTCHTPSWDKVCL